MSANDPETVPSRRFWRRRPRGLIGALALIAGVEATVGRLGPLVTRPEATVWRAAEMQARSAAAGCDVVLLGDSLVKFGVLPRVLAREGGLEVVNLAVSGGQAPTCELLLRHALRAGARPGLVVIGISPRLLELPPSHNAPNWPEMASPLECAAVAGDARDPELFGAMMATRWLPSYRGRMALRGAIASASTREWKALRSTNSLFLRNIAANDGALVATPKGFANDLDAWMAGYFNPEWECDPANERALRRLLDLTAGRGIRVAWLITPLVPEVQDRCRRDGFDARFDRFLGRIRAEYPHLALIDGRGARYDPAHYFDPHHLARDGAILLSIALADVIRRPAGDLPAVVALPDPGTPPDDLRPVVEDYDQSRTALREEYARRRR